MTPLAPNNADIGDRHWHYGVGANQTGPVDTPSFVAAIRSGVIRADTPVWTVGMEQWRPAGHIPNLAADLAMGARVVQAAPPTVPGALSTMNPTNANAGLEWILPVGRSMFAVIAGYLGLLSVLGIFAPFAIIFGVLALVEIKKNPTLRGRGRAWLGISLGTICTLATIAAIVASAL